MAAFSSGVGDEFRFHAKARLHFSNLNSEGVNFIFISREHY
jgi:hypothetical protein